MRRHKKRGVFIFIRCVCVSTKGVCVTLSASGSPQLDQTKQSVHFLNKRLTVRHHWVERLQIHGAPFLTVARMDPPFYDNSNTIHYNYNNDCSQSAHTVIHKGRDNWSLLVCSTCCVSSCFVNKKLFF